MKKSLFFIVFSLFLGQLMAQTTGLVLTTSVTAATACTTPCNGTATVTSVTGGTPPYTYIWNIPSAPQQTQTATGLCPGTYQVGVSDASTPFPQLGQALVTIICATTTGTNESVNSNNAIIISPVPAEGELYLHSNFETSVMSTITIYAVTGAAVQSGQVQLGAGNHERIDISDLPSGQYWIEVNNEIGLVRKKFIKQ